MHLVYYSHVIALHEQYAPLSLTGEKEVIMVSLRGGSDAWQWHGAPSVSPVVGE